MAVTGNGHTATVNSHSRFDKRKMRADARLIGYQIGA
jgi:hypothetical protein